MRRLFVALVVAAVGMLGAAPVAAQQSLSPRAWIVVDADTGRVVDAANERTPLPPASLSKVFTALAAVSSLPPSAEVPVSARTEAMTAHKINMRAGERWPLDDTLHALLLSSANDAAGALAERMSGTQEAFAGRLAGLARQLQLADHPTLQDPAGLDDGSSIGGGNLVSARDLAIAGRAVLADPTLAPIVGSRAYRFADPHGGQHHLVNHNKLLRLYDGAIGMKTGYTRRSGHCLLAAARREGRTMLAVVLGVPGDMYGAAAALLDRGFTTPVAVGRADILPAPPVLERPADPAAVPVLQPAAAVGATGASPTLRPIHLPWAAKGVLGLIALLCGLRMRAIRRQARRRAQRARARSSAAPALRSVPAPPPPPTRPRGSHYRSRPGGREREPAA